MKTRKTIKPSKKTKTQAKPEPKPSPVGISWPVFDSISQCASATGVPEVLLKRAKDSGCMAFRGSRVYYGEFIRWHFSQAADGREVLDPEYEQAALAKERRLALEEKRERRQKESEFMAELEGMLNEQLVLPCRAWLMNAPASLAGRCNPSNPEVARKILSESFINEFFPLMRTKLAREKKR